MADVQHNPGRWFMTFPRQTYHGVLQPNHPHSAGLLSVHCAKFLLLWEALLESPYKESGTGYGERPLTGPYRPHFLRCGWAQFCSRSLAWWETCTVQARPGQGGPHRAHLLCRRQRERKEGRDKACGAKWRERGWKGIRGKKKMRHKNSQ